MSRAELVRLVDEAEADGCLRRSLRHCRSGHELVLAARRLGYRITRVDLAECRSEHRELILAARRTVLLSAPVPLPASASELRA